MTHANGLVENTTINNRLQPTAIQASSLLTLGYKYTPPVGHTTPTTAGNNGNIYEQTVTPGTVSSMYIHYDYDGLNRIQWASGYDAAGAPDPSTNLTCASGTSPASAWCHHYSMDAYGNRLIDNRGGLSIPPGEPTAISASTNRATASGGAQWGYDTNGNVMVDGAGNSFTYDAENRQLTGGGAAYAYDGQGRRVTRTQSGGTATFVYDAAGQLAAEYGATGPASPCGTTCYVTADHLGSTRLVTNQSMTPVERVDYLPYGEEMTFTSGTVQAGAPGYGFYAAGDVRQRFTGKERDGETGLDYFGARYFGSAQGRFTSADDFLKDSHVAAPQSWNKYAYARNNPLSFYDPTGTRIELIGSNEERKKILDALKAGVGNKAAQYLTEKKSSGFLGLGKTHYYVNTTDAKGFANTNAVANKIGGLIADNGRDATIKFVDPGTKIGPITVGSADKGMTPGLTASIPTDSNTYLTRGDLGSLPGVLSENGKSQHATLPEVLIHELGHVDSAWYYGGRDTLGDAVRIENQVRQMEGVPRRIGHGSPWDVLLGGPLLTY